MSKLLIVQGGGFKTAFTAGILDSFMEHDYQPFDGFIGVSGGAIAVSYYLSQQQGACMQAMHHLTTSDSFFKIRRTLSEKGYMDIDHLRTVAHEIVPFELQKAITQLSNKTAMIVATNKETGQAEYLIPKEQDWVDIVIASCTLPFVTKGSHRVDTLHLMDGSWSDPLPVQWAVENGATEILILRTTHIDGRLKQSWPDYLGSKLHRSNKTVSAIFARNHLNYNKALSYIEALPPEITIRQIWPEKGLQCGDYGHGLTAVKNDYNYGKESGLEYLQSI